MGVPVEVDGDGDVVRRPWVAVSDVQTGVCVHV